MKGRFARHPVSLGGISHYEMAGMEMRSARPFIQAVIR